MAENAETTASAHPVYELQRVSFRFSAPYRIVIQYGTSRLQELLRNGFPHDYVQVGIQYPVSGAYLARLGLAKRVNDFHKRPFYVWKLHIDYFYVGAPQSVCRLI